MSSSTAPSGLTEGWAVHGASWDRCHSRLVSYFPIQNQFWAVRAWKEKFPALKDIGLPSDLPKSDGEPVYDIACVCTIHLKVETDQLHIVNDFVADFHNFEVYLFPHKYNENILVGKLSVNWDHITSHHWTPKTLYIWSFFGKLLIKVCCWYHLCFKVLAASAKWWWKIWWRWRWRWRWRLRWRWWK